MVQTGKRTPRRVFLRPVDVTTIIYLLFLSLVILLFHGGLRGWGWYIGAHLTAICFILMFIRIGERGLNRAIVFLRHWYPALLFFPLFAEMNQLVTLIFPFWANDWLIGLDHALFGVHPTVWFEKLYTPILTDVMVIFYLVYFLLIPVAGFPLYLRKDKEAFHGFMFNTALAYYVSYAAFLFFPAESPRVTLAHLQSSSLQGGFLLDILRSAQKVGGIHGGAFPSSHVAAAFAILLSVYHYERRLFRLLLPFVLGLAVSTTYCRYHYAVDAIAGALVGALCVVVGNKIYQRWEGTREPIQYQAIGTQRPGITPQPCAEMASAIREQRRNHVERT